MKQVTIIIPNYNGRNFLRDCMEALEKQTYKSFDILVIDNASSDDSVSYLRSRYPDVRVEVMQENLGFSGGVNVGIRMAKTPYVILLNNDTEVEPTYVEELVKAIRKNPRIFSASPKMVQFHDRDLMDDAGDLYTVMGWAAQRGVGRNEKLYNGNGRIFTACAGAAIYRRSAFERIGYFDESHFAYLEDIDIGYRARLYGYTNVYAPKAVVYHVGSGTSGSKYNAFKVRLAARNSVYVNVKNMALWQLILNGPFLVAGHMIKILFFKKKGFGKEYVSGLMEGLKTAPNCKKSAAQAGLVRQMAIQAELCLSTITYTKEFLARKLTK